MWPRVLVPPRTADGMQDSVSLANQHGSPVTVAPGEGKAVSLRPEDPQVGGLEDERQILKGAGLSAEVIGIALASTRPTSRRVHDARWRANVSWCDEQGFDPIQATVSQVFDFLQENAKSLQLNTVLGYVTTISKRHVPV